MTLPEILKPIWVAGVLVLSAQAQNGMEVSDFRVPEYDDLGEMTSQIFGERAEMKDGGVVKITTLRIEFYQDGETRMTVRSPVCFYDQKKRIARSEEPVFADGDQLNIRGRGFFLDSDERTVRVLNDCRVTVDELMQSVDSSAQPTEEQGTNEVTVITSKELFLDYRARKVRFEENVHVEDPEMKLDSKTLELHFNENNEIDWIEALTDVKILREGQEAKAGKAVYDIKTDEFVLEDNPSINDGENTLYGNIIRFRRNNKQMLSAPGGRLVIYPDDEKTTDLFEN